MTSPSPSSYKSPHLLLLLLVSNIENLSFRKTIIPSFIF
jgi:hypothetical protein